MRKSDGRQIEKENRSGWKTVWVYAGAINNRANFHAEADDGEVPKVHAEADDGEVSKGEEEDAFSCGLRIAYDWVPRRLVW